jgi:hypothetical protein
VAVAPAEQPPPGVSTLLPTSAASQMWLRRRNAIVVDLDHTTALICSPSIGPDTTLDPLRTRITDAYPETEIRIGRSGPGVLDNARQLLRRALLAAFAGHIFPELGPVVSWPHLFPYRLLLETAITTPAAIVPPDHLAALFVPANQVLLETAEAYLDHAGDRTATAEALYVHRSTLYYRIGQIHKLTGLDLADGHDRLALHLAVKLHRIADSGLATLLQDEENLD